MTTILTETTILTPYCVNTQKACLTVWCLCVLLKFYQDRTNEDEDLMTKQHAEMHELELKQSTVAKLNKVISSQMEKLNRAVKLVIFS